MTTSEDERTNPATLLGFKAGQVVQEIGYDDDCDQGLREGIASLTGKDLVDEDYEGTVDAVLLWFRDGDGDLYDALVGAANMFESGGDIWLCTPESGRDTHIEPGDIDDAATTAGLSLTKSISVTRDWTGTRMIAPKR